MIRNQRPNSNDCDRNVYLAFLPMRQKQNLVMLEYHTRFRTQEKKKEQDRTHSFSWNPFTGSNWHE